MSWIFCLHVLDGVRRLNIEGDGLARQGLDEDLHSTAKAEHEVQRRFLLDVVVRQRAAVLQLLAGKDQALLIRGNALLVLDLLLHVLDGVRRLNIEGDGLAREGLDEDLHTTAKAEHEVQRRFLLDVVVRQACGRPPAACRQRSGAADPGGCPPCPGSSASRSRWCPKARHRG